MPAAIQRCYNINDLHALARRRLPGPIYHYLEGGADDEYSLANVRRSLML